MRLRFLDMEPDEIFEHARKGDRRCANFVDLWHRALAAATASMIHLEGPGQFYFTGREIGRLDLARLKECLYQMVKMSPLAELLARSAAGRPGGGGDWGRGGCWSRSGQRRRRCAAAG